MCRERECGEEGKEVVERVQMQKHCIDGRKELRVSE